MNSSSFYLDDVLECSRNKLDELKCVVRLNDTALTTTGFGRGAKEACKSWRSILGTRQMCRVVS